MANYIFKFKFGFSVLCLFFFVLFCLLGVWQIHRYHAKQDLLRSSQKRITVTGYYLNDLTLFVQNPAGFEVFTPLKLANQKKLLLISRGQVSSQHVEPIKGEQHISGYIKNINEYQFILGKNILQPDKKPLVMQKIDIPEIEQVTRQLFYPYILRMHAPQSGYMMPQRHLGYALQWFLMAFVLLIAYLCFCFERKN